LFGALNARDGLDWAKTAWFRKIFKKQRDYGHPERKSSAHARYGRNIIGKEVRLLSKRVSFRLVRWHSKKRIGVFLKKRQEIEFSGGIGFLFSVGRVEKALGGQSLREKGRPHTLKGKGGVTGEAGNSFKARYCMCL